MTTAILKHVEVKVIYNDWSHDTYPFKSQNAAKTFINGLNLTEVHTAVIQPVWSQPGESVPLEVHQQGEDDLTEREVLRVKIAIANARERQRLEDNQKRLQGEQGYRRVSDSPQA